MLSTFTLSSQASLSHAMYTFSSWPGNNQGEGNVGLEWHQALENRAEKVILKNLLTLSSFRMLESLFDLLFTWVCYFIR